MLIAITGATGFLGRYIVRRLASAGHRLRCWHRPASDRSGFEVLAALRGDPRTARTPVVVISASSDVDAHALAVDDPAVGCGVGMQDDVGRLAEEAELRVELLELAP